MATSLELAITAIRSNRRDEGRQLLNLLIQQNPNDEKAWLWMSSVVDTDEQRARCLYHVLAINPDNQVARRGLQLLGIVVSDSRPVKVPRDSQPIRIPKPVPPNTSFVPSDTHPLKPIPKPQLTARPAAERRPFRLNPQEVVDELPFKPITKPFTNTASPAGQTTPPPSPLAPAMAQPGMGQMPPQQQTPSEPVPVLYTQNTWPSHGQPVHPSEPVGQPHTIPNPIIQQPSAPGNPDSGPVPVTPPINQGGQFYPQQPFPGMPVQDTRPSQPVPVVHANPTLMMPGQYGPAPGQYQSAAPLHSNATMMMPASYGQVANPSEPVPVIHSNVTMGMPPSQQQPQGQQLYYSPQNYAAHSNSTTMMPVGANPFMMAAPQQAAMVDYRVANAMGMGRPAPQPVKEDEGEEINVLAVVVFGSLSVTALGGLGMLILLMFAT